MPPLFRRGHHEAAPHPQLEATAEAHTLPPTPYEFVADNADLLRTSAEKWLDIGLAVAAAQGPEAQQRIRENLDYVYSLNSLPVTDDTAGKEAIRLTKEMGTFFLLIARHKSGGGWSEMVSRAMDKELYDFQDTNIGYLLRNDKNSSRQLNQDVFAVAKDMRKADFGAQEVLRNLVDAYASHPAALLEMSQLYEDGAAEIDPLFKELKEIITVDWSHYDHSRSVLRQYCEELRGRPEYFVNAFAEEVANAEQDRRLMIVKNMATFAVAAADQKNLTLTIEEALVATYNSWPDFTDIDAVFVSFVEEKVAALENAFSTLAESHNTKSIRIHRSRQELDAFKRSVYIHYSSQRSGRRFETKARGLAKGSRPALPSLEDITDQVLATEANRQPRDLMLARNTERGTQLFEARLEDIAKMFSIKQGNGLEADVLKMISRLQVEPISPAAVRIRSGRGRLVIGNNRLLLWRFAPDDSPNLGIHPANRYQRIVYGILDNKLIIVDILDHASFDKKYR